MNIKIQIFNNRYIPEKVQKKIYLCICIHIITYILKTFHFERSRI